MNVDEDVSSFLSRIPTSRYCCLCFPLRCGTISIAILGIVYSLSCGVIFLLKDRKIMTISSIILIGFLSVFLVTTIVFVVVSVVLWVAVCDNNPDLMISYIWLAGLNLCVQLVLAIFIPLVLAIDGKFSTAVGLIWLVAVMIFTLTWVHYISVVNTFRMKILYGENAV